jgi:hypothetical protein
VNEAINRYDPPGTPSSQKMFSRNSSEILGNGSAYRGGMENTAPRIFFPLSHFRKPQNLGDLSTG